MTFFTVNDITIASFLIKISGWLTLFIVNWKIGLACFIIAMGDKMQRNLIDRMINNTLQHLLSSVTLLAGKDIAKKIQEEKKTEIDENIKNN